MRARTMRVTTADENNEWPMKSGERPSRKSQRNGDHHPASLMNQVR